MDRLLYLPNRPSQSDCDGSQMIVVVGGRRTGKTAAICRWLAECPNRRGIIVLSEDRKLHILNRLHDHMPNYQWGQHLFSVHEMVNMRGYGNRFGQARGPYPEMAIDDTDEVLSVLFGATVKFAAINATYIPLGHNELLEPIRADASITPEIMEALAEPITREKLPYVIGEGKGAGWND